MRLTLSKARSLLSGHAPEDQFLPRLNMALERLLLHGKFKGSTARAALTARKGQAALPLRASAILGARVNDVVVPVSGGWYSFLPGKAGEDYSAIFEDLGDHPTMVDVPPQEGTLSSDHPVMIAGFDAMHMPVMANLVSNTPVINIFSVISAISKTGQEKTTVTHSTAGVVAVLEPGQDYAEFHRYLIPAVADKESASIVALVKLRHVPVQAEGDLLPFSNVTALGLALDAIHAEAELDLDRSDALMGKAVGYLNLELVESRSPDQVNVPRVRFAPSPEWPRAMR